LWCWRDQFGGISSFALIEAFRVPEISPRFTPAGGVARWAPRIIYGCYPRLQCDQSYSRQVGQHLDPEIRRERAVL